MEKKSSHPGRRTAWFARPDSRAGARRLLFCLPHAGAGAGAFRAWSAAMPRTVEVVPVQLPGREQRLGEPHDLDPDRVARAVAARADRPYALYGHSLGARLGFEVIRTLRRRGGRQPELFYAAAARPPDVPDPLAARTGLTDDDLLALLDKRISAPSALRDEPELRELLLPVLRADLEWLHTWRHRPEPPLDVPVVALAGAADRECTPAEMAGWSRHTTAYLGCRTVPGDHFFLLTAADHLAAMVAADLIGPAQPAAAGAAGAAGNMVRL